MLLATIYLVALVSAATADPELLFHASYDSFHANAEFAKGDGTSSLQASLELRSTEGLRKSGLLVEEGETCDYAVPGNLATQEATLSMWVKPKNWAAADRRYHHFFGLAAPTPKSRIILYVPGNATVCLYMEFGVRGTADFRTFSVATPVAWRIDEWHKLDATWTATQMRVYVDGRLGGELALPDPLPDQPARFGRVPENGLPLHRLRRLTERPHPFRPRQITELPGSFVVGDDLSGDRKRFPGSLRDADQRGEKHDRLVGRRFPSLLPQQGIHVDQLVQLGARGQHGLELNHPLTIGLLGGRDAEILQIHRARRLGANVRLDFAGRRRSLQQGIQIQATGGQPTGRGHHQPGHSLLSLVPHFGIPPRDPGAPAAQHQ
ncbi:LamG domain-containing protein [bacterium]|nr:LamG domain-containing protein [bacterium]